MSFPLTVPTPNGSRIPRLSRPALGWLYLAVILDLFSRQVVGWSMSATEDGELVELALRMAVARRHPEAGLLHHSDRGTEFTCDRYQAALRELGVEVSMRRTGNCWDNAAMEAETSSLKASRP